VGAHPHEREVGKMRRVIPFIGVVVLVLALTPPARANTSGEMHVTSDTILAEDHDGVIIIDADGVTLDCANHIVTGSPEVWFGILVWGHDDVTIQNCRVTNALNGIAIVVLAERTTVAASSTFGNVYAGVWLDQAIDTEIVGSTATQNQGNGFTVFNSSGSRLEGNEAGDNGENGFEVSDSANVVLSTNRAEGNDNRGYGFWGADGLSLRDNEAFSNAWSGFEAHYSSGMTWSGNTAAGNGQFGFLVTEASSQNDLEENLATGNGLTGFILDGATANHLVDNTARQNGLEEGYSGFDLYPGSSDNVLIGNRSKGNGDNGFYVSGSTGNVLRGNQATGNPGNGILLLDGADGNTLQRNTTARNANAGISLQNANANLVTDSVSENNAHGVVLSGASRNVFIGNQFIDNAPYYGALLIDSSNNNRFEGNIARGNEYENFALVFGSSRNELVNNVSQASLYEGISLFFEAEYNVVRGNLITGNAASGVLAHDSDHNVITGNRLMANNRNGNGDAGGIALREGSSFNTVTRNVACGNGNADAYEDGSGHDNLWQANKFCTTEFLEPPVCVPPPEGLVGWWPGDDTTGDLVAGHDATLEGDAKFGSGKVGRAFVLDGDGDYVDVAYPDAFNFGTGEFTVDLWVRFNDLTGEQVLAEKWIQRFEEPSEGWTFTKLEDNALVFATSSADGADDGFGTDPLELPTFQWLHLAVVRSSIEYSIYMNGELIASAEAAIIADVSSTATLKFGHRGDPTDTPGSEDESGFYLNGMIDEVEVFDRALSPDEIRAIWEAGSAGKCKA
jgi:parallel beta-helix repeat protein